jgi:hypothetical protein
MMNSIWVIMSQHLIRSSGCKAFITGRRTIVNDLAATSGPHAPTIQDVDDCQSSVESGNEPLQQPLQGQNGS